MKKTEPALRRLRRLGKSRPGFRFGFARRRKDSVDFSRILPLQKSWPATLFIAGFLLAFCIPFFAMSGRASGDMENLFDLIFSFMFLFGTLMWGMVLLLLLVLLLAFLFARERIIVDRKGIELRIEILGLGISSFYPANRLARLRHVERSPDEGSHWRGEHLCFDYFDVPVAFGSAINRDTGLELRRQIENALGFNIPEQLSASVEIQRDRDEQAHREAQEHKARQLEEKKLQARALIEAERQPLRWNSRSGLLLIAANLIPLAGVLWFGWDIGNLFLLFWLESAIIGLFNVLKMFVIDKWQTVFMGPFFIAHYGIFMSGHLLFIFGFFLEGEEGGSMSLEAVSGILQSMWPAVLALFISHGFSFLENFIGKKEYLLLSIRHQMHEPYKRIIVMHITIIFGGFMVLALNAPVLALVLLILLKTGMDLAGHVREHTRPVARAQGG